MIKRTITETIYEYDEEGKITRKIITETKEEDDNKPMQFQYTTTPYITPERLINNDSITITHSPTCHCCGYEE